MHLDDYQKLAMKTRKDTANSLEYMALGLVGEAGEIANKVKKVLRGDYPADDTAFLTGMEKEIGDALWYIAGACEVLGFNMTHVAMLNLKKLEDRQERGVIKGDGDDR